MAKKKDTFKLEITDLRLLRIRRVCDWKIYFDYNGEHYMIISDDDEESHTSFYKREIDSQGKVTTHCLCGVCRPCWADTFIRDVSKKHKGGLTYCNIDREFLSNSWLHLVLHADSLKESTMTKRKEKQRFKKKLMCLEIKCKHWKKTGILHQVMGQNAM